MPYVIKRKVKNQPGSDVVDRFPDSDHEQIQPCLEMYREMSQEAGIPATFWVEEVAEESDPQ